MTAIAQGSQRKAREVRRLIKLAAKQGRSEMEEMTDDSTSAVEIDRGWKGSNERKLEHAMTFTEGHEAHWNCRSARRRHGRI